MSTAGARDLATLESGALGLSEVTDLVAQLEKASPSAATTILGLSGNVTIDLLGTYLRKEALLCGRRAEVRVGAFGDHLGNVKRFVAEGIDAVILLDLFDAVLPALEARVSELGTSGVTALADKYRNELALILRGAATIKDVFISRAHRLSPPGSGAPDPIDDAVATFNDAIESETAQFANVHLISTGAIAARIGWERAHDGRSYQRFRAPFTPAFLDAVAEHVFDATHGFGSYYFKALVLDCDGTLWGGNLGDDLPTGIKLDPFTYPGSMFWRVQHEFLKLQRRGVLLGLCSKNNPEDVDAVLESHPDMVLRDEHLVTKRVNWGDKVTNLESIASELNIGLDSIVFVDDSSFECEAVRSRLPMVKTLQVPTDLSEYPQLIRRLDRLFTNEVPVTDGAAKTEQYRARRLASEERRGSTTEEEYLASLEMKVAIRHDDRASSSRIAELTQKSNQFNLTTRRYSKAQIDSFMDSGAADVYSIHVSDRFGDAGLTGVLITTHSEPGTARIDSFLMSCRVLGRGVETSFWESMLTELREKGFRTLVAEFVPTMKNMQVRDFWDRLGISLVVEDEGGRREYCSELLSLQVAAAPSYIEVTNGF